jgi:vacuolar-type H+-ATPase subunit I/STV1
MESDEGQSRTEPAAYGGQAAGESGWTTTDVSARALGVTPRTVRRFIDRGDLEGRKVERGIVELWEVSIDSLYSLRDKRNSEGQVRRTSADKSATKDTSPDNLADVLRELSLRLEQRASSEAELRTRLELTERTESSLREERDRILADLERERERAEQERERAEEVQRDAEQFIQEREQAQEEARRLREELEAERSKGFWRRLLGG